MKAVRGSLVVAAMVAALGSEARAGGALVTAPMIPGPGGAIVCSITNASGVAQTVTVEVFDDSGSAENTQSNQTLAPGGVLEVSGSDSARFCRFTGASRRTVRAAACVFDVSATRCIAVSPAS